MDNESVQSSSISDKDTVLGRFAALGVNINGLIVPGRHVEGVLARHAFNLVVNNDHEVYKVSLVGSATAVKHGGRYILLTTQHQLRGTDEQQVAMLTDSGSHVITSSGRRGYTASTETDANDIVAFDFTAACEDHPELKLRFFDLTRGPPDTLNVNVLGMLLAGYPTKEQTYDVEENNHLGLARRQVVCVPHDQPTDDVLLMVRAVRPLQTDPDGMSGGSAFVIQLENGQPHAYFAGIIVRGGREYFHILKAGVVLAFLRAVFA